MTEFPAPAAPRRRDCPILAVAVVAAFASAILAISEHAEAVDKGYRLAAVRRERDVLLREALRAERKVSILSIPTAVAQRATAMRLGLEHPKDRRILTPDEVTALLAPPASPPESPARPPIARPPEGMAK